MQAHPNPSPNTDYNKNPNPPSAFVFRNLPANNFPRSTGAWR